jgi:hypothetical protein
MKKMTDITSWLREQAANDFTCEAKLIEAAETIEHWRGHAERLRQDCEFHLAEIEGLEEQVLALQHIADRDEAEIARLKAITWAQAGEIDKLVAANDRLTKNVAALQFRLYLNQLPHGVAEDTEK